MRGAPPRLTSVSLQPEDHAYGPIGCTDDLRQAVADRYNRLYRICKASKYTKDNVSVAAGGRLMIARVMATLGATTLGYQIPDYTAYEDMLDYHQYRVTTLVLPTTPETGFVHTAGALDSAITRRGLGAFLFSNRCNPTGQSIAGQELADYCDVARNRNCAVIYDEFYSHFVDTEDRSPAKGPVSAAEFVDYVE